MDIKKTLCLLAFLVLVMGMISAVSAADDGIMLADDSGIGGVSDSREIGSASTDSSAVLGDDADSGTNTDDLGTNTEGSGTDSKLHNKRPHPFSKHDEPRPVRDSYPAHDRASYLQLRHQNFHLQKEYSEYQLRGIQDHPPD